MDVSLLYVQLPLVLRGRGGEHCFSFGGLSFLYNQSYNSGGNDSRSSYRETSMNPGRLVIKLYSLAMVLVRECQIIHGDSSTLSAGAFAGLIAKEMPYWDNWSTINLGLLGT